MTTSVGTYASPQKDEVNEMLRSLLARAAVGRTPS